MGFLASKIFLIVILSLIAVTTFLQCLGITLDYWWRTDDIDIGDGVMAYVSGGLWGACQTTLATGSAQCAVYPYVATLDAWFNTLRAFACIGVVLLGMAGSCTVVSLAYFESAIPKLLSWIFCFAAFLFIFVEWILFVIKVKTEGYEVLNQWGESSNVPVAEAFPLNPPFSTAFILTVIADVCCIVCGVLGIVSWRVKRIEV